MSNKWEKNLEFYDKLIEKNPKFIRKGKTVPYTSANGYMFSQLNKDGEIGIRLPKKSFDKFIKDHKAEQFRSYGANMRGYVLVPDKLFKNMKLLSSLLQEGYDYVMSLEPKATKK